MIRPLFDRVIVRPITEDTGPAPLIVIPDAAKEKPTRAVVVVTGPGALLETPAGWSTRPMQVKPGDVILYGRYTGQEIKQDGETLLIMREEDVIGIEVE